MADSDKNFVMRGHKYLKKNYPLGYEAAQLITPIGIGAAALEGIDAASEGNPEEFAKAVLSAVPVSKAYRVGKKLADKVSEVTGTGSKMQKAKAVLKKAGAGENVAEAGEAGYDEGELLKAQRGFKKGGSVKGWGQARGARAAKIV